MQGPHDPATHAQAMRRPEQAGQQAGQQSGFNVHGLRFVASIGLKKPLKRKAAKLQRTRRNAEGEKQTGKGTKGTSETSQ
jgi:hypothetical protein